jgi:hypothetical protein
MAVDVGVLHFHVYGNFVFDMGRTVLFEVRL